MKAERVSLKDGADSVHNMLIDDSKQRIDTGCLLIKFTSTPNFDNLHFIFTFSTLQQLSTNTHSSFFVPSNLLNVFSRILELIKNYINHFGAYPWRTNFLFDDFWCKMSTKYHIWPETHPENWNIELLVYNTIEMKDNKGDLQTGLF